jgi:uncharacterized membrane protein
MAKRQGQEKGAAAYGREALSQWGDAVRYGGRAIAARLREPSKTEKGGRAGDAADAALAKLGAPGKLASKVSLGSRILERVGGIAGGAGGVAGNGGGGNGSTSDDETASESSVPAPIQEAIDVAVPLSGTFSLCSRFLDFPTYLDRVAEAEEVDDTHFVFDARVGRHLHEIEVEIVDEREDERIDWECAGEFAHSGVLTFHPLAPRLTRVELTIEREPESLSESLSRRTRLAGRAIQAELHRFKAHAELVEEDFEDYVPEVSAEEIPPEEEDEELPSEEEEGEDEEPLDDEAEELDEGQVEEEELEPA